MDRRLDFVISKGTSGETITPEVFPLDRLLPFLSGFLEAVREIAGNEAAGFVAMPAVVEGSYEATLRFTEDLVPAANAALVALNCRSYDKIPYSAACALHRGFAAVRGSRVRLKSLDWGVPEVVVDDLAPLPEPEAPTKKIGVGTTTIYGQCVGIGGQRSAVVKIKPDVGGVIECKATKAIAKILGGRLYEVVALEGDATWDLVTWTIVDFRVKSVVNYAPDDFDAAVLKLRNAVGDCFEDPATAEFLRDLRDAE